MRAHFAGDVVTPTGNAASMADELNCTEQAQQEQSLEQRIVEFKQDSKNMEVLEEFIEEVLQKAEKEAIKQQKEKNVTKPTQPKEKSRQSFAIPDFKNGKVVNRARGLVVRIFDAICNCANSAAAPATRIKLRGKRSATAAAAAQAAETADKPEAKESKSKKQDNSKDKKGDKKKKTELEEQKEQEQALLKDKATTEQPDQSRNE